MKYKKKARFFKILKNLTLISLILFIVFKGVLFAGSLYGKSVLTSDSNKLDKPLTFFLSGTDYSSKRAKAGESARSDTAMIATLNPSNNRGNIEINVVSIPRDLLVEATCLGTGQYSKLTDTTSHGFQKNQDLKEGIECTKDSLEKLLNINIDYYVSTGFDGVINIINGIGGIDVEVPYDFCEQNEEDKGTGSDHSKCTSDAYFFKKGQQHLNGQEALSFARQRYQSSDYDRNIRQQQVMVATAKKIMENPTANILTFTKVFFQDVTTNIDQNLMKQLANFSVNTYNNATKQVSLGNQLVLDMKTSAHQNSTASNVTGGMTSENVEPKPLTDYYSASEIYSFENETQIARYILNKDSLSEATANTKYVDSDKDLENKDTIVEVSFYSMAVNNNQDTSYGSSSNVSYETLYYTSNLLRTGVGLPEENPTFKNPTT